ncbi:master DNA invertase Mpi family serine-type recombinase [uncultured Megamonas sp.]|uniref:master DNA invertase Mpi family serine-type recombinase n=1 Tax=uncultured Megamonas sp. TaxID=286140 RepID=UPI0025995B09|nr:master DNA invertase Mpi family serine-type recombinase [uncultured Megamonas sp.]
MVYGYVRVSTDKQITDNQHFEIESFCNAHNIVIDKWYEETISGCKTISKRKLGSLLKKCKKDDIIICTELSRLGRSLFMIMDVLSYCLNKEAQIWTIKENYRLGIDISSKVLAFAFGLSAEIERNLISLRTKEALARLKEEGKILGRPKGSKNKHNVIEDKIEYIKKELSKGKSMRKISKKLKVHPQTLKKYIRQYKLF